MIDIVRIGKQLLMTRGSLATFSIANDVAKYFAIIPALFTGLYPELSALNTMHLHSPQSAVLSAIIYNALIIIALISLALKGVKYRELPAGKLLSRNLLIYGLGGLIAPFMRDKLQGKHNPRIVAVEPASCPSLTRGRYAYDFCDTGHVTPLARMYTLGSEFIPSANHAGGLRYHGMSPILSKLYHDGYMEAVSVEQTKVFEAATFFAKHETILPAPESSHAIRAAMDEAIRCRETGEAKTILFGLTGTGYFDMTAYSAYHDGKMTDYIPTDADLQKGFDALPKID